MTNYDFIKNRTIEEVAKDNIKFVSSARYYVTSDGSIFSSLYNDNIKERAINHEIEWLKLKRKE